ncbi:MULTISPECIES: hypothetical protein [unclassified Microcoleus]|uniref:hypothetical protein n=1 Tax=unclassified Microcoleus TaxID=2642155 RepID=UPI001D6E9FBA|nr:MULTISPECIES: hypothetical protein [unclassified Microcoleus]MCC3581812.1 hypothetical protein [Microcoleus sp. PH2017_32_RDM_D_A]MCC3619774.1 hypothetical protein [Microcoleus sp. PH2017_38_RDM_U_B]
MTETFPKTSLLSDGWKFVLHSPTAGEIINPQGTRQTAYFGFDSQAAAEKFMKVLVAYGWGDCQIRPSKRLDSCQIEVKVWNCADFLLQPHLITKTVGYARTGDSYKTYLLAQNGRAYKYKTLSEGEFQTACVSCIKAGWKLVDCTDFARWFCRQSRMPSAPRQ